MAQRDDRVWSLHQTQSFQPIPLAFECQMGYYYPVEAPASQGVRRPAIKQGIIIKEASILDNAAPILIFILCCFCFFDIHGCPAVRNNTSDDCCPGSKFV